MRLLLLNIILLITVNMGMAQTGFDVEVYLKDGSSAKGKVIDFKKDDYIILEIGPNRTLKFLANEIQSIHDVSNFPADLEEVKPLAKNNHGIENNNSKWSLSINHLTGIGIGRWNSGLLNLSPSVWTRFSVSPLLQMGLGIGYSNIQSTQKNIILRSGATYAYPNGTNVTTVGVVNPTELQTVSFPATTSYELINSQLSFRINYSQPNKPVRIFTELGFGFAYAPTKDLNLEMESGIETRSIFGYDPNTGLNYRYYSFQYFADFRSRYTNAFLMELGTGVNFKTINKQHLGLKLSYQNTRGNINYTYTKPYAVSISGILPPNYTTLKNEIKGRDFLNMSFIALCVDYSF